MGRIAVDVVVQSIREESRVIIVDMTIGGEGQRFRFERIPQSPLDRWSPGPGPHPIRQAAKFIDAFKSIKGRSEVIQLIARWDRGERLEFPVHLVSGRPA